MARRQGITSFMCECGQVFNTKKELEHHRKTDCPLRGQAPAPAVDVPTADTTDLVEPAVPPELEKAMAAAKDALSAKDAPPKATEPPKTEAPKVEAKRAPIIIPYSMCDKRIQILPTTRPVFLIVMCMRREDGLEVESVKPGWK